jgi:hypothetical protein
MNYVGLDWAYGRAAFCELSDCGEIEVECLIPADEDGLARLALGLGPDVKGCVEMMSGAIWVKEQLELCGWSMAVAHARKVRDIAGPDDPAVSATSVLIPGRRVSAGLG